MEPSSFFDKNPQKNIEIQNTGDYYEEKRTHFRNLDSKTFCH